MLMLDTSVRGTTAHVLESTLNQLRKKKNIMGVVQYSELPFSGSSRHHVNNGNDPNRACTYIIIQRNNFGASGSRPLRL